MELPNFNNPAEVASTLRKGLEFAETLVPMAKALGGVPEALGTAVQVASVLASTADVALEHFAANAALEHATQAELDEVRLRLRALNDDLEARIRAS